MGESLLSITCVLFCFLIPTSSLRITSLTLTITRCLPTCTFPGVGSTILLSQHTLLAHNSHRCSTSRLETFPTAITLRPGSIAIRHHTAATHISSRHTSTKAHSYIKMNPSKEFNTQDDCPFFKLAVELRNEIYSLVFAIKTNDRDNSTELNGYTAAPSKSITMTCHQIRNESLAMFRAAYCSFPNHDFVHHIYHRRDRPTITLSNDIFSRITTIRATWSSGVFNPDKPHRFTTHFSRIDDPRRWNVRVEMHGEYRPSRHTDRRLVRYLRGPQPARHIINYFESVAARGLEYTRLYVGVDGDEVLSMTFSRCVHLVCYHELGEQTLTLYSAESGGPP
jgi:hypothetical protein